MKKLIYVLMISLFLGGLISQKTQAKVQFGGVTSGGCNGSSGICMVVKGTPYGDITYYGKLIFNY